MALRLSLLVAAVLVATAVATAPTNVRVVQLSGRLADPINFVQPFTTVGTGSTDPTPSQGPNANVFYLPSARSAGLSPAIDAGTQDLVLTTLPAALGVGALPNTLIFGLATIDGNCGAANGAGIDTTFASPVSEPVVVAGDVRTYTFEVPTGTATDPWNTQALEFETALGRNGAGRKLCIGVPDTVTPADVALATWKWSGLYIRVAWDCALPDGPADQQCSQILADTTTRTFPTLSALEYLSLDGARVRTTCCKSTTGLNVGVCVNPRAQTCCGGNPVSSGEKCCSVNTEVVTFDSSPCPCRASQQVLNVTTQRIVNTDCNEPLGTTSENLFAADQCCLPSVARFRELVDDATGGIRIESGFSGYCYSTNGPLKCCDTGELYDPGSQQCCVINGLQNATVPCVCSTDAHCLGAQTDFHTSTQRCCRSTFPDVPAPQGAEVCTAYANFPFQVIAGSGGLPALPGQQVPIPAAAQRCFGTCIDTNFQICCNGVACARNFERCCNTTCCNRFTATCRFGVAQAPNGSPFNSVNFRQTTVRCSSVYYLHGLRSFFIFALPGFLLLSTLLGLAVVLVFANKASNRSYSFIESGMILFAVIAILFACPVFFSPAFKYGVLVVLVGLATILSAAARVRSLNVLALAGIVLALLYVFDPFTGNQYLNFVSFRAMSTGFAGRAAAGATNPLVQVPGQPDYKTNGLLHLITNMWRDNQEFCVNFYDYFRLDDTLLDFDRFDNPAETTYGYCRRGWVFALLIFEIIMMGALIILLVVTLLALLLRFRKAADLAPVELEVKML